MLQKIRDRFTGIAAVAIVGAIGLAMTITLVERRTFTGSGNFAARVNGEEIPLTDYRQVAQRQLLAQEQQRRSELSPFRILLMHSEPYRCDEPSRHVTNATCLISALQRSHVCVRPGAVKQRTLRMPLVAMSLCASTPTRLH